jgi:arylsulfatase A-like enzyme
MRIHQKRFVVPRSMLGLAAAAFALPFTNSIAQTSVAPRAPNVLFISFDDLSDWIQPLDPSSPIAMPQLDRLAQRGVMFRRAYCTAPECNPSRTSLLSGYRPTTTGVYANASDWKQAIPDAVMLPHYFRQHGYTTAGAGKIFHHVDRHFHDEASFDDYLPFETDRLPPEKFNRLTRARTPEGEWEPLSPTFDWGPSPTPEDDMLDSRSATYAAEFLARTHERPFFLAVGFFRPHLPYFAPRAFLSSIRRRPPRCHRSRPTTSTTCPPAPIH